MSVIDQILAEWYLLRGPLIQRASFVQTETAFVPGETTLQLTYNVSETWAGATLGRSHDDLVFHSGFSAVVRGFQARTPIQVPESGPRCANCSLSLPAFGFAIDCTTSHTVPYNISGYYNVLGYRPNATVFNLTVTDFVNQAAGVSGRRYLSVTVVRRATNASEGFLNSQTCLLKPAIIKYDLLLNNGSITFQKGSWRDDSVVSELEFRGSVELSPTISALQAFGAVLYDSSAYLEDQGARGWVLSNKGLLANTYYEDSFSSGFRGVVFLDPMDDILNAFREVALRMSIAAAADAPPPSAGEPVVPYSQTAPYTSELVGVVYRADRGNLALGVIVSLLGPVATLALFWGWWKLGRPFTFSPLEVANAFHPPSSESIPEHSACAARILAGCNGNATAAEVVKHARESGNGDPLVCYGVVGDTNRLCMGLASNGTVRQPELGDKL